jgi:hypothetical protein
VETRELQALALQAVWEVQTPCRLQGARYCCPVLIVAEGGGRRTSPRVKYGIPCSSVPATPMAALMIPSGRSASRGMRFLLLHHKNFCSTHGSGRAYYIGNS